MNKLSFSVVVFSFLISACGPEEGEKKATDNNQEKEEDSVVVEEPIIEEPEQKERVLLPRMDGGWIRDNLNNPVFYSEKVDSLVAKWKEPEDIEDMYPDYSVDYLTAKQINTLTINELIYYCLAYPSSFAQICAEPYSQEDDGILRISGYMPFGDAGVERTLVQDEALRNRKEEVEKVLVSFIDEHPDQIHADVLGLLISLDCYKAIPLLIETASDENIINYTALLYFIGKEDGLKQSLSFYVEMFGEDSYQYGNTIKASREVRDEIEDYAMRYYNKRKSS